MRTLAVCVMLALGAAATSAQRAPRPVPNPGGNQLLYIGTYAGTVQIFDETSEAMIGDIKLKTVIPRSLTLSQSRKRFYVLD